MFCFIYRPFFSANFLLIFYVICGFNFPFSYSISKFLHYKDIWIICSLEDFATLYFGKGSFECVFSVKKKKGYIFIKNLKKRCGYLNFTVNPWKNLFLKIVLMC